MDLSCHVQRCKKQRRLLNAQKQHDFHGDAVLAPLMSHIGTLGWLTGLCRSLGVFVVFPLLFCVMGLICMRRDDT